MVLSPGLLFSVFFTRVKIVHVRKLVILFLDEGQDSGVGDKWLKFDCLFLCELSLFLLGEET